MAEGGVIKPIPGEVTRIYQPQYESLFPFRTEISRFVPKSILPNLKAPLQIHYEQNFLTPDENFPTSFISKLENENENKTTESEKYASAPKFTSSFMDSLTPADLKLSQGFIQTLLPGRDVETINHL